MVLSQHHPLEISPILLSFLGSPCSNTILDHNDNLSSWLGRMPGTMQIASVCKHGLCVIVQMPLIFPGLKACICVLLSISMCIKTRLSKPDVHSCVLCVIDFTEVSAYLISSICCSQLLRMLAAVFQCMCCTVETFASSSAAEVSKHLYTSLQALNGAVSSARQICMAVIRSKPTETCVFKTTFAPHFGLPWMHAICIPLPVKETGQGTVGEEGLRPENGCMKKSLTSTILQGYTELVLLATGSHLQYMVDDRRPAL